MSNQDILNCSFPLWYPHFSKQSIDSLILKIPKVFIDYLLADGLFLPDISPTFNSTEQTTELISEDEPPTDQEVKAKALFLTEEFKDFHAHTVSAIAELGGKVFPKLNWSSPRDAAWIAVNASLCCETFNDICLLLKSSDFITHDLTNPFLIDKLPNRNSESSAPVVEYVLVLRRWLDINSSAEYRCFVKNNRVIAISQRSEQYFNFIETGKESISRMINRFYKRYIFEKFSNQSYTFDVYIPGHSTTPILLDFNPYLSVTDGLLFSWDELHGDVQMPETAEERTVDNIVFRHVPDGGMAGTDMRKYAFPLDFQHLSTGEDPAKLIDLLKLHQRTGSSTSTDSD